MTLRRWQSEALRAVSTAWLERDVALVVAPTGVGKTRLFTEVLRRRQEKSRGRALVLAPTIELTNQAAAAVERTGLSAEVEQADRIASKFPGLWGGSDVVAACLPTMARRASGWPQDAFRTVAVDEAHLDLERAQDVIQRFPGAKVLGLTATPNEDTIRLFGRPAYEYALDRAILDGALCPVRAEAIDLGTLDLSSVKADGKDLNPDELGAALTCDEQTILSVATAAARLAEDRQTIAYLPTRASAEEYRRMLGRILGHDRVDYMDGETPSDERAKTFAAFRAGRVRWLVNVGVLTTGVDLPFVSCIAMLRPTKSATLLRQCVGRGLRVHPGKTDCLVILIDPAAEEHSLCSTIDLFVDDLPEDIRRRARRAIDGGQDQWEAIANAKARAEERRRRMQRDRDTRLQAVVEAKTRVVDLFKLAGLETDPTLAKGSRITEAQAQALRKAYGRPDLSTRDLSQMQFRALMAPVEARRRLGLCTLAQSRLLRKHGLSPDLPFETARAAIDALAANGWRMPA